MAANGRKLLLKKGASVIAAIKTKTFTIGGEPVDITNDDSDGYRTYLAEPGQFAIDVTADGIFIDQTLGTVILGGGSSMLTDISLEFPDGGKVTGNFFLAQWEASGTYNDAITFSIQLQSSGQWTYTP